MDWMPIVIWILVGLAAGWLASLILGGGGLLRNIVVGLLGAVVGGWLLGALGVTIPIGNAIVSQIIVAFIGALVVILVARVIAR